MSRPNVTGGKILPRDEFEALFGDRNSVKAEATRIIQEAQDAANALRKQVSAENSRLDERLSQISDQELKQFIDTEMIDRSVEAFAAMLDQSASLHASFLELSPWLVTLVDTCVSRVIGTLEDTDVVARLVGKGIEELCDQTGLTLLAHPDDNARLQAAIAAYPNRFSSVTNTETSVEVPSGLVRVRSAGGLVDVDLSARLDRLIGFLETQCAEANAATVPVETHDSVDHGNRNDLDLSPKAGLGQETDNDASNNS